MNENENADRSGASSGFPSGFDGVQPASPPSIAQAFLTGLSGRIAACHQDLQQTRQDAMITMDDPAMEHYNIAAEHLNAAHLAATSVAAPLEMAEIHLEAFKAAVNQNARNATEATSQSDPEDPVQQLRALLTTNKNDAVQALTNVISVNFWNEGIARHYLERAELLEGTFSGNGDEHAVMVLLAEDVCNADKAFADATSVDSAPHLSGASYVHRDAANRLFKLKKSIQKIPGVDI